MRKKTKRKIELILILTLFTIAAASNALSRADTEKLVESEVYAAQQLREDISLAQIGRIILGSAK